MMSDHVSRLAALTGLRIASRKYGGKAAALRAFAEEPQLAGQFLRQGLAVVEVQLAVLRREGRYPFPGDDDDAICRRLLRWRHGLPAFTGAEALAADVE